MVLGTRLGTPLPRKRSLVLTVLEPIRTAMLAKGEEEKLQGFTVVMSLMRLRRRKKKNTLRKKFRKSIAKSCQGRCGKRLGFAIPMSFIWSQHVIMLTFGQSFKRRLGTNSI
jgi:hypothetical protein